MLSRDCGGEHYSFLKKVSVGGLAGLFACTASDSEHEVISDRLLPPNREQLVCSRAA